tara:strand:- start:668 stop:1078 length:411 start_codon:yes stop_codon:yes gene_type:complete
MIKFLLTFSVFSLCFSQRGETGDKTFVDKFPPDVIYEISSSAILIRNTVDHDIIVCIRDQYKKYLNHVYIRNNDEFLFTGIPITRLYVQYKSKEFYFEDKEHTVINYGERHTFDFFFDASKDGNFIQISQEEFLKP